MKCLYYSFAGLRGEPQAVLVSWCRSWPDRCSNVISLTIHHLLRWVMNQRAQYQNLQDGKKSWMTQERIDLLEGLGFKWGKPSSKKRGKRKRKGNKADNLDEGDSGDEKQKPSSDVKPEEDKLDEMKKPP